MDSGLDGLGLDGIGFSPLGSFLGFTPRVHSSGGSLGVGGRCEDGLGGSLELGGRREDSFGGSLGVGRRCEDGRDAELIVQLLIAANHIWEVNLGLS